MTKTHETDEFEDWARLAASIGQHTQRRREVDTPRLDDTSRPEGKSKSNGCAVNGHETANGHVNGNGVKVDQLPNFLLQGPDVDDEPPASEPNGVVVAEKVNGATGPRVTAAGSAVPAPFLLMDALSEDLEIPPEPAMPSVDELQRPLQGTVCRKAKNKKEPPPAKKEQPKAAVKSLRTEALRSDFDGLPSSLAAAKRVGISAPPLGDRPGLSRRRLENRLKKGATITAVGVTIGGVAVAILYIVIIATTTVL